MSNIRRLLIRNPDLANVEKTFLTAAYASGTSLSVTNSFAWAANDLVIVGNPGEEKAEIKKIDAIPSDNGLTLASALKFTHPKDTVLYKSPWDQVEISGNSGSGFSVLSTSGLQFDKQYTVYVHDSGGNSWSYRWRFKNSITGEFSEYSPTYSGSGFDPDTVGYIIRQVRKLTNTEGDVQVVTDSDLVRFVNEAHDIIYGIRPDWWFLKFEDSTLTTTADSFRYNLDLLGGGSAGSPAATFKLGYVDKVRYNFNDGSTNIVYPILFLPESEFDELIRDNNRTTDDYVTHFTIRAGDSSSDNGYLECYPTPKTTSRGTFYIRAFRKIPTVDDDIDTTPIPIPSIIENYLISQIERIRGNDTKAEYYEQLFYGPAPKNEGRERTTGISLLEQLQRRSLPISQPRSMWRFRGHRAVNRLYNNRWTSRDHIAETFY